MVLQTPAVCLISLATDALLRLLASQWRMQPKQCFMVTTKGSRDSITRVYTRMHVSTLNWIVYLLVSPGLVIILHAHTGWCSERRGDCIWKTRTHNCVVAAGSAFVCCFLSSVPLSYPAYLLLPRGVSFRRETGDL